MHIALQEFFDLNDANFYYSGIKKLLEKWQEVIEL